MRKAFSRMSLFIILVSMALGGCRLPLPPTNTEPLTTSLPQAEPIVTATNTIAPSPTITPTPLPEARVEMGSQALFIGDYDRAITEHQQAVEIADDKEVKISALTGLGRSYYESGNYSLALSTLRQATDDSAGTQSTAKAYFALGQTYEATFQYTQAAQAYAKYLELQPEPLAAFVLEKIGSMLFQAQDYNGAISAYQQAIDTQEATNLISLQIQIGRAHAAMGDYSNAIRTYLNVYDVSDNEFTRAQANLLAGQAYLAIGENEQAYARFLDSVNNYPRAYDSYSGLVSLVDAGVPVDDYQRGLVDYYAGQYGVAIDAFARYLRTLPDHTGAAHYYKGLAHLAIDEAHEAVAEFQALIQDHDQDPNWIAAWEELAYTQWAYLDQHPGAAQTLLDFAALYPQSAEAPEMIFSAAQIYERGGRLTEAAQTWERLITEYPSAEKTFRGLFLAGISHFRLKDYVQSQAVFQRVLLLSSDPGDQAMAYLWIGKSLQAQGEVSAAKDSWEHALNLDPTGYYSERAAELLEENPPFTTKVFSSIEIDWQLEREKAESWVRVRFNLAPDTDLGGLGEIAADPSFIRALEFHHLGLFANARNEFEVLREQIQADPVATMRLLKPLLELGYYRSAIFASRQVLDLAQLDDAGTLTAPPYFNYIRFGTYYTDQVIDAARAEDLDPYFLWSVIRQESLFEGHVISSAGAAGLMQIMPDTGAEIASRLNWPENYSTADLYRPVVNLRLGASYLSRQRNYFGGDWFTALAAYNAGPGNSAIWNDLANGDPDLFLEIIRFEETRTYIRQIYEFWQIYNHVYNPPAQQVTP